MQNARLPVGRRAVLSERVAASGSVAAATTSALLLPAAVTAIRLRLGSSFRCGPARLDTRRLTPRFGSLDLRSLDLRPLLRLRALHLGAFRTRAGPRGGALRLRRGPFLSTKIRHRTASRICTATNVGPTPAGVRAGVRTTRIDPRHPATDIWPNRWLFL
jgi:hypothetical protein